MTPTLLVFVITASALWAMNTPIEWAAMALPPFHRKQSPEAGILQSESTFERWLSDLLTSLGKTPAPYRTFQTVYERLLEDYHAINRIFVSFGAPRIPIPIEEYAEAVKSALGEQIALQATEENGTIRVGTMRSLGQPVILNALESNHGLRNGSLTTLLGTLYWAEYDADTGYLIKRLGSGAIRALMQTNHPRISAELQDRVTEIFRDRDLAPHLKIHPPAAASDERFHRLLDMDRLFKLLQTLDPNPRLVLYAALVHGSAWPVDRLAAWLSVKASTIHYIRNEAVRSLAPYFVWPGSLPPKRMASPTMTELKKPESILPPVLADPTLESWRTHHAGGIGKVLTDRSVSMRLLLDKAGHFFFTMKEPGSQRYTHDGISLYVTPNEDRPLFVVRDHGPVAAETNTVTVNDVSTESMQFIRWHAESRVLEIGIRSKAWELVKSRMRSTRLKWKVENDLIQATVQTVDIRIRFVPETAPMDADRQDRPQRIQSGFSRIQKILSRYKGLNPAEENPEEPFSIDRPRESEMPLSEVFLLQMNLLHDAGILNPATNVFYFLSGADPFPGYGVKTLRTVDMVMPATVRHRNVLHWKEYLRTAEMRRAYRDIPLLDRPYATTIHQKKNVLSPSFVRAWTQAMKLGDVVFLKYSAFWLDTYLAQGTASTKVLAWYRLLLRSLPTGVLIVLVEDARRSPDLYDGHRHLGSYLLHTYPDLIEDVVSDYFGTEGADQVNEMNKHPLLQLGIHSMSGGLDFGLAGMLTVLRVHGNRRLRQAA